MTAIHYQNDLRSITPTQLQHFFEGWPKAPLPETLFRMLSNAYALCLAVQDQQVIGFVYAISDGVLAAYIPLLEVRPQWHGQGIGQQLLHQLLAQLADFYMVDTACDDHLVPFYERFGMQCGNAMILRRYECQAGRG